MYEPITTKRLDDFGEIVREYNTLLDQKKKLEIKISKISSFDYSKPRVISGNSLKTSEQERFAMALEKINQKLKEYENWLIPEREIIKTQIARVKRWEYRKILVLRYIERWKWSEITFEFFGFEDDFNEEKHNKYKDTIMYWHRQAITELQNISAKPYIPPIQQLILKEENNA